MASFSFTSAMLDEGTMFAFGSKICITNGSSGFNSHLSNTRKPEVSASTSSCDIDNLVDDLGEFQLSDLIGTMQAVSGRSLIL
jgi:hypothetical protein